MGDVWRHYVEGGKNDHVFHNACLDYVISFCDNERSQQNQPHARNNIAHADNCASQHKCRQNFFKIASFGENHGQNKRIIHKFASKHGFKGPWDATGKVVKEAILRNEYKFERCSNATDCYFKLSNDMNKVTNPKQHSKWIQWETEGDEKVLKNAACETNRTFVGLGIEDELEHDNHISSGYQNIIHTNRTIVPDMKVIPGTQKLFHVEGFERKMNDGTFKLEVAKHSCSCIQCRSFAGIERCLYKNDRKAKTLCVREKN